MKKQKSIRLSPKHGVNAAIPLCFFCGEPKNEVILAGRLKGDMEAPHSAVWDRRPCDKCAGLMTQGVMLLSVRDGESGDNPHRTGAMVVVRDDVIRRLVGPEELVEQIIKSRVCFVPDEAWDKMGLPRGAVEKEDNAQKESDGLAMKPTCWDQPV